jgi:tRNA threonylcarbamoyladenosine biosynthesis protein TsaE
MEFITRNQDETIALGKKLGSFLKGGDCVARSGNLAAGKTTLAKGIALALGVTETVTSPTFTIISEYQGTMPFYHFDVYRLESSDDFINIGADDLLFGNGVCVIEWSERVKSELPERAIFVALETLDGGARKIIVDNWEYAEITDFLQA